MGDITLLLTRAQDGDRSAVDSLFALTYPELRRLAHARLAGHEREPTLDTTVLVHECYLRFVQLRRLSVDDRNHFMAYAARAMRSIVVDTVRAAGRARRGGDVPHVSLDTLHGADVALAEDEILEVDAALTELAQLHPRLAQVVEMRYFAGMQELEIAQALGVTDRTVRRDWEKARLLLAHALRP